MTIVINGELAPEESFKNEDELQNVLFENPALLQWENVKLYPLKREVPLEGDSLDILYLGADKNLVAVEVKRGNTSDKRRKVVAQILDYASAIMKLSYDRLNDECTENELQKLIDSEFQNQEGVKKTIESNLQKGGTKLVIAVDKANKKLERIVNFLLAYSDLHISLVEISKYKCNEVDVFVSKVIVKRESTPAHLLDKLETYYNGENSLQIKGKGSVTWRVIHLKEKDWRIRYAFHVRKGDIGVELHAYEAYRSSVQNVYFNTLENRLINGYHIDFHAGHLHTLRILLPFTEDNIPLISDTMRQFIELTKPVFDEILK